MKFTAAFGVAALFMAPSAAAWKLPVSIYTINPHRSRSLLTCLPSTPTRPHLLLLPVLLPVASLVVSHLEPQLEPHLSLHLEPHLSLHLAPHLELRLEPQLDSQLDSPLAAEHLVMVLVLRDPAVEAMEATESTEGTVMDPSPPASPPASLPAPQPALLPASLPSCLLASPSLPVSPLDSPVASPVASPPAVPSPFCLSRPRLLLLLSRETSLVVTPAICCFRFCTWQLRLCSM